MSINLFISFFFLILVIQKGEENEISSLERKPQKTKAATDTRVTSNPFNPIKNDSLRRIKNKKEGSSK